MSPWWPVRTWIEPAEHDLVLMGEIVEHLYTAPDYVPGFVGTFVAKGGLLVIQTPNAVSLRKRLRMMVGKHTYDLLNKNRHEHIRECTAGALQDLGRQAGFEVVESQYCDYWPERSALLRGVEKIVPSFRKGQFYIGRKTSASAPLPEFVKRIMVG